MKLIYYMVLGVIITLLAFLLSLYDVRVGIVIGILGIVMIIVSFIMIDRKKH